MIEMPTKYELQAKLRELNRGFPRIPISKLKVHEIEACIEAIEKLRADGDAILATKTPHPTGRPSARPIDVEEVETDGLTIRTPKAPAARVVRKEKKPVVAELVFSEDEDDEPIAKLPAPKPSKPAPPPPTRAPAPAPVVAPDCKKKSEKVTVHFCNCPNCPR